MGWADQFVTKLQAGETVQFRPHGNSMSGRIESGQLCTAIPFVEGEVNVDDIVLCRLRGFQYVHLVKAIENGRYLIGNNRGKINGWVDEKFVYGRITKVEP